MSADPFKKGDLLLLVDGRVKCVVRFDNYGQYKRFIRGTCLLEMGAECFISKDAGHYARNFFPISQEDFEAFLKEHAHRLMLK